MIYEFQSRATGTIVMTAPVAERLLGLIGKAAGPQGIITVAQLPGAIARLNAAVAEERQARAIARHAAPAAATAGSAAATAGDEDENGGAGQAITLAARALPLIGMFERALAGQRDVTWGV